MVSKKPVRGYTRRTGKAVTSHLRTQNQKKKAVKVMFDRPPAPSGEIEERPGQGWVTMLSKEKLWIGPKVNLSGKNLSGLQLRNANLESANLEGAWLKNTDTRGANLRGANLSRAKLEGAQIGGADLRDINWKDVRVKEVAEALVDSEDIFSQHTTKYNKHSFQETVQRWEITDKEFERLVTAGHVEIRDNGSHLVVEEHFNPWEHHVAGWQHQNPPIQP